MTNCKYIDNYIKLVRSGEYEVCQWQLKLCDLIEYIFENDDIFVDEEQAEKYLSYQKYFPFKLFEWEVFCFVLHNCVYWKETKQLRFPVLAVYVGRGAGKNGYLGFEDFCLLTDTNGIRNYDIDIFATSERQAKQSFEDIYNVLEQNKSKMKSHFHWTKEKITNLKTNSDLNYNTSSSKTKDGFRPGKVDFDELHAYPDRKLIDVAVTGLGKVSLPRQTIITTDGLIRGGVLDEEIEMWKKILEKEISDNGVLPFLCQLDDDEEVWQEKNWYKANPSLQYLPNLLQEMRLEFINYKNNPSANTSFISKRMNRPPLELENAVTSWDNILKTDQPIDENIIQGKPCVAGIDYMKTTDFMGAGLLYRVNGKDYWISHTWVCKKSADLSKVKAPIQAWANRGLVTYVDAAEIPPELPVVWCFNEAMKRNSQILKFGMDSYRFQLLSRAFEKYGYQSGKDGNVIMLRPSDEMLHVPIITSGFVNGKFCWGDDPCMRWQCNNAKTVTNNAGNIYYGKIEPKSRKTDTFKAFVCAECVSDVLDMYQNTVDINLAPIVFDY